MEITDYSQIEKPVLTTAYYIYDYLKSPRVLIFLFTVAFIVIIKKILIERMDAKIPLKPSLGIKDVILAFRFIGYSFKNCNSERMTYKEWKESLCPVQDNIPGKNI